MRRLEKKNADHSSRLGIFVFYDQCGIVDRYIEVLLDGVLPCLEKLVVVVNGYISESSEMTLRKYTDCFF